MQHATAYWTRLGMPEAARRTPPTVHWLNRAMYLRYGSTEMKGNIWMQMLRHVWLLVCKLACMQFETPSTCNPAAVLLTLLCKCGGHPPSPRHTACTQQQQPPHTRSALQRAPARPPLPCTPSRHDSPSVAHISRAPAVPPDTFPQAAPVDASRRGANRAQRCMPVT